MFESDNCTVSLEDEELARKHGVLLVVFDDTVRAFLVNVCNGIVIRRDNIVWVKSQARKYNFPITHEVEFKSFYISADYKKPETYLGKASFRYVL